MVEQQLSIKKNLALVWRHHIFLKSLVLIFSYLGEIIWFLLFNFLSFYVKEMKLCSYNEWQMSSQEQIFNVIGLFFLEKRKREFFNNSDLWMVPFKITSLSVS